MPELAGTSSFHVLVVDDDHTHSRAVARVVRDLGYRATEASGWTQALRAFGTGEGDVDLVLMDAVMPTVDGFKLTKILRSRVTSYVPIVFLTGLADEHAREQGVAVGADDFLTKPVDQLELKVRLKAMLRIRQLTRALEAKTRELDLMAHVDTLTGAGNRRNFDTRIVAEMERTRRSGTPLSVIMFDLDHFKAVNDTLGHGTGDAVLAFFGKFARSSIRACDELYRLGGEEFLVMAPDTNTNCALTLAERLRAEFELRSGSASAAGPQTVSVGVASTESMDEGVDGTKLLAAADSALYRAKTGGRNCVFAFDAALDQSAA